MTHSHQSAGTIFALTALAFCPGCASGPTYRVPIKLISNTDIAVVRASSHRKPDGIIVGGDVRRPNGYAGVVPGHLRVIGYDASGAVAAVTNVPWGAFMNRRFRLAYFEAFLRAANPSEIATISVEPVTRKDP